MLVISFLFYFRTTIVLTEFCYYFFNGTSIRFGEYLRMSSNIELANYDKITAHFYRVNQS